MNENITWETKKNIEYVVSQVKNRGWADIVLNIDNFSELRNDRIIREAQVTSLYEEYFLPDRHEFEWQLLSDIVYAVINAPVAEFTGLAIAGGVTGNMAYDLFKNLCLFTANQLKEKMGKDIHERADGFIQMANDADRLKSLFQETKKARISEIEEKTGISRERIYPLMKLAGLNHHRRVEPCFWEIPN